MKRLLVIIALLLALPLSAYEFKVTSLFQVQDEAILRQAAELQAPVLFVQTDIPSFLDDGPNSIKVFPGKGGYLVQLDFYPRQREFFSVFVAPNFVPLDVPFDHTWNKGEVFGVQVTRTGKDPERFNPNAYEISLTLDTMSPHMLPPNDSRRRSPCVDVNTDLPLSEVTRMFKANSVMSVSQIRPGVYTAYMLKGKTKPKDFLMPAALLKLKNMSENQVLGVCEAGPYRMDIKW